MNKIEYQDGSTVLIVESRFEGLKTLQDIFEDIIVNIFRRKYTEFSDNFAC